MEVDRMFLYKLKVQESNNEADQHLKKVEAALEAVRKENKDLLKAIDDLKQGNSKLLASLES